MDRDTVILYLDQFAVSRICAAHADPEATSDWREISRRILIDSVRIAGALPCADALVVDGAKASWVRQLKLDEQFGARIFSGKKADLAALDGYLDAL